MQDSLGCERMSLSIVEMNEGQIISLLDNIFGEGEYIIDEKGELSYKLSDVEIVDRAGRNVFERMPEIKEKLREIYRTK